MQETFALTPEEVAAAPPGASSYLLKMEGGDSLPSYDQYTYRCAVQRMLLSWQHLAT